MTMYFYIPKVMCFFLFCFFVSRNHGRVHKDIPSAHHNSNNHFPSKQCNISLRNTKQNTLNSENKAKEHMQMCQMTII